MANNSLVNEFLDFCLTVNYSASLGGLLKSLHSFVKGSLYIKGTGFYFHEKNKVQIIPWEDLDRSSVNLTPNNDLVEQVKECNNFIFGESSEKSFIKDFEEQKEVKWYILFPLTDGDKFFGILFFYGNDNSSLNSFSIRILMTISKYFTIILSKKVLYDNMEQRLAELLTLQSVSDFVNSTLDFEKLIDVTLDAIVGLIGLRTCSITIFMDKLFDEIYTREQRALIATMDMSQEIIIDLNKGLYQELATSRSSILGYTDADEELINLLPTKEINPGDKLQFIILPVIRGKELYGSINIFDPTLEHINNIQNNFLESFANQFSIALQNANLYRKQEEMANRDGLTNLFNHAFFQNRLSLLVEEQEKWPLSLILIDIDDFKQVNDFYGHLVGDKVLKELSSILKQYTRDGDLVARYGGEEFAVLLPETCKEEAFALAERLREKIEENKMTWEDKNTLSVTVSVGVAVFKSEWTKEHFINVVDQSLYKAKDAGKNRVMIG